MRAQTGAPQRTSLKDERKQNPYCALLQWRPSVASADVIFAFRYKLLTTSRGRERGEATVSRAASQEEENARNRRTTRSMGRPLPNGYIKRPQSQRGQDHQTRHAGPFATPFRLILTAERGETATRTAPL